MRLYTELLLVVDALQGADAPFAICGGLAVAIHGYVRATKDIDLLVPASAVESAKKAVKPIGYSLPAQPMTFAAGTPRARRVHRVSKIEGEEHMVLDLLELSPADQEVWDSRLVLEWEGKRLCVVSRAGLARMKRVAGREQDLLDLENLGIGQNE